MNPFVVSQEAFLGSAVASFVGTVVGLSIAAISVQAVLPMFLGRAKANKRVCTV